MENNRYTFNWFWSILTWSPSCVLTCKTTGDGNPNADSAVDEINNSANALFFKKDTKLYVAFVTLSTKNDNELREQLKIGFKRTIRWNIFQGIMN